MKNKILGFVSGVLVSVIVLCASVVVFADSISKSVEIFFKDIKICIDGTYVEPKDANGNKVEPFILDGTTYLPVRAVANAFGKDVEWDSATSTVFLGAKPGENKYGRTNPAPIGTAQVVKISNYSNEYTANVVVKEVISGEKAWEMIKDANMFNSEPKDGKKYVLVNVAVTVSNVKNDAAVSLSDFDFDFYRTDYSEYDSITFVVTPEPSFGGEVYEGGTIEGYICREIDETDVTPSIVFGNDYKGQGGIWFSLTK